MEAIDFVVMKDGKKIADTVTANIGLDWDGPGWTMKLKKAVIESKATFTWTRMVCVSPGTIGCAKHKYLAENACKAGLLGGLNSPKAARA